MKNLDELRSEIDKIDADLAELLKKRLNVARSVAEYKAANNLPIYHKGREDSILNSFSSKFSEEEAPFARAFLKSTIRQSREYQYYLNRDTVKETSNELTPSFVYYPGLPGSHSAICAKELYPEAELCACNGFSDVFNKINNDNFAIGVLPIDNSTAGTVGDVYDLLIKNDLSIVRAATRSISHFLLAPKGAKLADIKQVYSHPQALIQCSGFIKKNGFISTEASNTATAAEYVAKLGDKTVAAIASKDTALLYGLDIIAEQINDENNNQTRFICISKTPCSTISANKMSLAFDLPNEPGALSDILSIFSDSCINLTKILSRPIPTRPWEYTFYLDCVYTPESDYLSGMLTHLRAELPSVKMLGIYHEEDVK